MTFRVTAEGGSCKIHGVKEEEGEDLGNLAPKIRDSLKEWVDIVHHIRQRRRKEAKGSKFLLTTNEGSLRHCLQRRKQRERIIVVKKAREDGT